MHARILLLGIAVALPGCYEKFDRFAQRASRLTCKRFKHCDKAGYNEVYDGDHSACRDEIEDAWQDKRSNFEDLDCSYDPEVGRECIRAMYQSRRECADSEEEGLEEACALVFDCFSR